MPLKRIQELFVESVRSQSHPEELLTLISPGGSLTNQEALSVYSNDYKARMQEALGKNYEATWLISGDEDFFKYADEYIKLYPSTLRSLTTFGESFPDFLANRVIDLEIVQMAQFERDFWTLFHASSNPPFELTQRIIETAEFDLSMIQLFDSEMRLDLIWQHREGGSDGFSDVNIYDSCFLALFKADEKVELNILSQETHELLKELKEKRRIPDLSVKEYSPISWAQCLAILKFAKIKPKFVP